MSLHEHVTGQHSKETPSEISLTHDNCQLDKKIRTKIHCNIRCQYIICKQKYITNTFGW